MFCIADIENTLYLEPIHFSPMLLSPFKFKPVSGQLQVFYPTSLLFFSSPNHRACLGSYVAFKALRIKSNFLAKCKALHYLWLANTNFISFYSSPNAPWPPATLVQALRLCQLLFTPRLLYTPSFLPVLFSPLYSPYYAPSHTQFNVIF